MNRPNKSLEKSQKLIKFWLIKIKEKLMTCTDMKDQSQAQVLDLEIINLTSTMLKISLSISFNKIRSRMTFFQDFSEGKSKKRLLHHVQETEDLVQLEMMHFPQIALEEVLEEALEEAYFEHSRYSRMMTFSIQGRVTFQAFDHHHLVWT